MKVYISCDIEGVTGIVSWSQCGEPSSDHYDFEWARAMMTADVNAAIRGAKRGGAESVVVKDAHGNSKNLLVDQLEPGTELMSGRSGRHGGMMAGIDRNFHAALLVGYHAMAGTPNAILEHTLNGNIHRMWINDKLAGEIALSTALAGCFDVPVVMVSSDQAGCDEAKHLVHKVETAVVKYGDGRFAGRLLHPDVALGLIEEAAYQGVLHSGNVDPWLPSLPCTIRIEFHRSAEAESASQLPGVRRLDGYTVEFSGDSWAEVHQLVWMIVDVADLGPDFED